MGFFGICPYVNIFVRDLSQRVSVMLMFLGRGGMGEISATANILDEDKTVLGTAILRGVVDPERDNIILGSQFSMAVPREGKCTIQVIDSGKLQYENSFIVRKGIPPSALPH